MPNRIHDAVFVGGGLSAVMLLQELRNALPERVAVVDPTPPWEQPPVHWSYWSREPTPFDRFAIGSWRRASVADGPPQPISPYTLRLVRSSDVFESLVGPAGPAGVEWRRATARAISRREDGTYRISTDKGDLHARWVFDSACEIAPEFASPGRPRAVLNGTGVRVTADRPVFDPGSATLFDPIDETSFAYLLPLSPGEALLESAMFGAVVEDTDPAPLIRYLRERYPGAEFAVTHAESGSIPLGFAPTQTTGPRHVLLGTKRGLVKPSAGYGIVRIARESQHLADRWRERRPLGPSWRSGWGWRLLDTGFLRLAAQDPRLPMELLGNVMRVVPLVQSLRFIDEDLPTRQMVPLVRSASLVVLRAALRR